MNPIWIADFTPDHLQTRLMDDVLAVDVSQFIKLVSAKEESPSFSFLLCISRIVSPQEFHIDFILLRAALLLSGSPASIRVSEWIVTRSKLTLSSVQYSPDELSHVSTCSLYLLSQCLTCFSRRGCDTTEVAGGGPGTPPPVPPPASLLRLGQHRRHDVSVSGPAYSPSRHTRPSLISRAKPSQTSQVLRPPSASHGRWIVRVLNEKIRRQKSPTETEGMKRSF